MKLVVKTKKVKPGCIRAWCPSLPGCVVWGVSQDEARQKITRAVEGYLSSLDVALPRELSRISEVA